MMCWQLHVQLRLGLHQGLLRLRVITEGRGVLAGHDYAGCHK